MVFHRVATYAGALALAGALVAYAAWPQDYAMPPASVPGAIHPMARVDNDTICSKDIGSWSRWVRPGVAVSEPYKLSLVPPGHRASEYQLDDLIPLCLGGLPGPANWWLQPIKEAKVKDRLEARLCRAVCAGEIGLSEAQACIATNWVKCYSKMMGIEP